MKNNIFVKCHLTLFHTVFVIFISTKNKGTKLIVPVGNHTEIL